MSAHTGFARETALPAPGASPGPAAADVRAVADLLRERPALVLSGAGMSTGSGIPDYRGPDGQRRVHPMQYAEFVGSSEARRRYWARSFVGWQRFTQARPSTAHHAVTRLQRAGRITQVITQNVDGLHQGAGTREVIELHGALADVVCLTCEDRGTRVELDARMREANPDFVVDTAEIRPDGDITLEEVDVERFVPPRCLTCGRDTLKPDVVFFGESVPKDRVERCYALTERAEALLVLGSSLAVMSGLRFVRRAARRGIPVVIVTRHLVRGGELADLHLRDELGETLMRLGDLLDA